MVRYVDAQGVCVAIEGSARRDRWLIQCLQALGFEPAGDRAAGLAVAGRADAQAGLHDPRHATLVHLSEVDADAEAAPARPGIGGARIVLVAPEQRVAPAALSSFDGWLLTPVRLEELRLQLGVLAPPDAWAQSRTGYGRLGLIGRDPAFLSALSRLERYAASGMNVLICGETGVGKEKVARAIHYSGRAAKGPFVPLNCGALPGELFTNELFGHRPGAFTGGTSAAEGLVAEAEGGTLFLDEVDALSLPAQVALLRFLQERTYRRLGGGRERTSNARVVAATNTRIDTAVGEGRFRADLMFRLDVARIDVPSLKERPQDIALLAGHFCERLAAQSGEAPKRLSPDLVAWLRAQAWPGNVRELENFIAREIVCADGPVLYPPVVPYPAPGPCPAEGPAGTGAPALEPRATADGAWDGAAPDEAAEDAAGPVAASFSGAKAAAIERFEAGYLAAALRRAGGNVSAAARLAGKERRAFSRLLRKYRLDPAQFRGPPT